MADALRIKGLVASCRVGVTEEERRLPQTVWIDVELAVDAIRAAAHDALPDTVDYARLVQVITAHLQGAAYRLIETLAEDVARVILDRVEVPRLTVRVRKRVLPDCDYAEIEVTRSHPLGPRAMLGRSS